MDPLTIITSVFQIAEFAELLIRGIGRIVIDYRTLPQSIQELYDELRTLEQTLIAIKETFEKRPEQLPFERSHHENIYNIIQSCHGSLKDLERELPQLKDTKSPVQKICRSLENMIKGERVQKILSHINSYTTVLQLSLTTISLGSLWHTHKSQEKIQAEIRKLTHSIRATGLFSGRNETSKIEGGFEVIDHDGRSTSDDDLKKWLQTTDDVVAAFSLSEPPGPTSEHGSIRGSISISVDTLPKYEEDAFDPEPDYEHRPSRDIIEFKLEANQKMVNELMQTGIFQKASTYQRRGIDLREQLSQAHGKQCPFDELADMKEKLGDILLECDTAESDLEAKGVLQPLLSEEVARPTNQRSGPRRCRLYHKLGSLYFKQGNVVKARTFLERAFEGWKGMDPRPDDDVAESAELLVKVLQLSQAFDDARGIREWVRQELRRASASESTENVGINLTSAYRWCREKELDVDNRNFRFDVCDSAKGTTPIHLAIQAEDIDVLRDMLSHVPHVEQRDMNSSTPLHQAAAMRNKYIVRLLVEEYNAEVNVQDHNGMTPLHRCQTATGGVKVAELLLQKCPQLVHCLDHFGKTALFMACEKGNDKMVRCLLDAHAESNIQGPGGCTPLVAVIEDVPHLTRKIEIVKLLLNSGAEPCIRARDGRTAFTAASNAGLAGSEIKSLLKKAAETLPRRTSAVSLTNTMRGSRRGTTGSSSALEPSRSL